MSAAQLDTGAQTAQAHPVIRRYQPPAGLRESVAAAIMRMALRVGLKPFLGPPFPFVVQRVGLKPFLGPPFPFVVQRVALAVGSALMPQDGRAQVQADMVDHIPVERVTPKGASKKPRHAILYLHGGAFVAGSPRTHRSITRRLSAITGALVLAPHYRLAPEAPFPAQLDDCVSCYRQLLKEGFSPDRIAIVGDSAGGNLTFMTAIAAMKAGMPGPSSLVMMSPAFSLHPLPNTTAYEREARDPMIRQDWAEQVEGALNTPKDHPLANPMAQDLSKLPPSLLQVGEDEVLYDNSTWLVEAATAAGRTAELEVYLKRWHVFQVHAALMPSSVKALDRQAEFMKRHWAA